MRNILRDISIAITTTNFPKQRRQKLKKVVGVTISGLLILLGVIMLVDSFSFALNATSAKGQIVSLDQKLNSDGQIMYTPIIKFMSLDGKMRQFRSQSSSSIAPPIGKTVSVLYDPKNPDDARVNDFLGVYVIPFAFIGFGFLVLILGYIPSIITGRARSKEKRLRAYGKLISAELTGVSRALVKIDRRPYYVIQAQWFDASANTMRLIESELIPFDPSEFIKDKKNINVFINPTNAEDYWVDISLLPQATN